VHCYRLLRLVRDAEDALQETLLAAGQDSARFEGRASIRFWLYQIAARRCLNALRGTSSRLASATSTWPGSPNSRGGCS
jgi:DNA-directed RNA polymerase specialized sigma24 family protein